MINDKYEIINKINNGNFGNVYLCKYNNKHYAIKEEYNLTTLKNEANIYKDLCKIKNISKIHDFFLYNNKYYLVLDYFNITFINYKKKYYDLINDNYIFNILNFIKIIFNTLKDIHKFGYVHRDLKPNNICLDINNNPYIIDFGLSKKIIQNNKYIKEKKIHSIIGSLNFCSINVINLIEPSKRDDIESILLILFYMLINDENYIIYNNLNLNDKKNLELILNFIKNTNINSNLFHNIKIIFKYTRKMSFMQEPNYQYIINLLIY